MIRRLDEKVGQFPMISIPVIMISVTTMYMLSSDMSSDN